MNKFLAAGFATVVCLALGAIPAGAAIRGNYLEVRSADVYTGPCFANAEENLAGNEAILAWKVTEGAWDGVQLDGLGVVAVVKANATLGSPFGNPYPAKSVLILDERASAAQRRALEEFAKNAGGQLLTNVVRVETAPISLEVGEGVQHGSARLSAGNLARVETRSLCEGDHICGNEEVYYPPLTQISHSMPAFTLAESFQGQGLGVVWNRMGARSAFLGTFTR